MRCGYECCPPTPPRPPTPSPRLSLLLYSEGTGGPLLLTAFDSPAEKDLQGQVLQLDSQGHACTGAPGSLQACAWSAPTLRMLSTPGLGLTMQTWGDPRTPDPRRIHVTPLFGATFTGERKKIPQPGNKSFTAISSSPHVALEYRFKGHSCGLSSSFPLGLQTGVACPRGNCSPAEPFFKGDFFGQEKGMSDMVAE